MATRPRGTATSYDEILRRTVPDPVVSYRPSHEEETLSHHRFGEPTEHRPRPLTDEERELLARVISALEASSGVDLSGLEVEIDHRNVILLGTVPGPATSIRIEDIVGSVHGVDDVDNQLVIRSPKA